MAKAFTNLKDPKLSLTDKLTFGKLKDCRVCDVVEDHLEYLIWCEKQGFIKFSQEVKDVIKDHVDHKGWEIVEENKQDNTPIYKDPHHISNWFDDPKMDYSDWTEDVPF